MSRKTKGVRVFVALPLPDELRHELGAISAPIDGARWQDFDQLHMTLAFVGAVPGNRLAALDRALQRIRQVPFELALRGVGHFPGRGSPRVLWAGVRQAEELARLHGAVHRQVRAAGFELERRKFRPHVTLARLRMADTDEVARFLGDAGAYASKAWTVDGFELWRSDLQPEGARYEVVQRYSLAATV